MKNLYLAIIFMFLVASVQAQFSQSQVALNKAVKEQNYSIRYTFSQPDGDDAWHRLNHDDSAWEKAKNFDALALAVEKSKAAKVYIRIEVKHTSSSLNNLYFKIRHSGPFSLYVNGKRVNGSDKAVRELTNYVICARRPEVLGRNIYAIEFSPDSGMPSFLEIQMMQSPWLSTDEGQYRPAPVMSGMIRDAAICIGGDNAWYMTGTTGDETFLCPNPKCWLINPGIQVFRSMDLKKWTSLGYVWTFDHDGTWNKDFGNFCGRTPARGIFAPEIKYIHGKYWINYSVNACKDNRFFGIGLLSSDKAEGPYHEISPSKPITDGFDSNLFVDDDGTTYLLKHGGLIAKMKSDLSGLAEPFRNLAAANYPYVGYEGVHLFKYKGKYYLTSSDWNVHSDGKISYDSMVATADCIYGPYSNRYCALRFGGHNGYCVAPDGNIYATIWCYPDGDYHWQRVSIVKMQVGKDGLLRISNLKK